MLLCSFLFYFVCCSKVKTPISNTNSNSYQIPNINIPRKRKKTDFPSRATLPLSSLPHSPAQPPSLFPSPPRSPPGQAGSRPNAWLGKHHIACRLPPAIRALSPARGAPPRPVIPGPPSSLRRSPRTRRPRSNVTPGKCHLPASSPRPHVAHLHRLYLPPPPPPPPAVSSPCAVPGPLSTRAPQPLVPSSSMATTLARPIKTESATSQPLVSAYVRLLSPLFAPMH